MATLVSKRNCTGKIRMELSQKMINRELNAIYISEQPFSDDEVSYYVEKISKGYGISMDDSRWFVTTGILENHAYDFQDQEIKIFYKTKKCNDISIASDQLDRHFLEKSVTKYYLCFPKEFRESKLRPSIIR
jgi:adenosylcobinamide amidohydrolase